MTGESPIEILKQGAVVWNGWRRDKPHIDLSGFDLSGCSLTDCNLDLCNLSGANLTGAQMSRASLRFADLSGACLTRAYLWGAFLYFTNLAGADLKGCNLSRLDMDCANFSGAKLDRADLSRADLRGANLNNANLIGADLTEARLTRQVERDRDDVGESMSVCTLDHADLTGACLKDANLSEASLKRTKLIRANLSGAHCKGTDFSGADFTDADLSESVMVETDLTGATMTGARIYGVSAWNVNLVDTAQNDLVISKHGEPVVTVDNLEVGQFIYLMLNNGKIRNVITSITSKGVLILGRFADPQRKAVLDGLREKLREFNLLPMVFDFDRPTDRDYTETVQTLAGMSMFVIVDVTLPKSTPMELEATVKQFKIPYVPIIDVSVDPRPFAMLVDSQKSFHWVLSTLAYESKEQLLDAGNLKTYILDRAMAKREELRKAKNEEPEMLHIPNKAASSSTPPAANR